MWLTYFHADGAFYQNVFSFAGSMELLTAQITVWTVDV
jgi:hypothetical protein